LHSFRGILGFGLLIALSACMIALVAGTCSAAGPPFVPENVTATAGDDQVNVSWSPPADDNGSQVEGYRVYRGDSIGSGSLLEEVTGSFLVDDEVDIGKFYYYAVSAFNSAGEGPRSAEVSVKPYELPDHLPLFHVGGREGYVYLSWDTPYMREGYEVLGYRIYRGTSSDSYELLKELGLVSSYSDYDVTSGTLYSYDVRAFNAYGEGGSNRWSAEPLGPPGVPLNFTVEGARDYAALRWEFPTSKGGSWVSEYYVYRGPSAGGLTFLASSEIRPIYQDFDVDNGRTYYYAVTALNEYGEGPRTEALVIVPGGPPTQPKQVEVMMRAFKVVLEWYPPDSSGGFAVTGYNVSRGSDADSLVHIATLGSSDLSFEDTNVTIKELYFFGIAAFNEKGLGEARVVAVKVVGTPSAPRIKSFETMGGRLDVEWAAPLDDGGSDITGYMVYESTDPDDIGSPEFLIEGFRGEVVGFLQLDLELGVTRYYTVAAVNEAGEGERTETFSVMPTNHPESVSNLQFEVEDDGVHLTWIAPSDGGSPITSYWVYKKVGDFNPWIRVTEAGAVLNYTDADVEAGKTYQYYITAVNEVDEGKASNTVVVEIEEDKKKSPGFGLLAAMMAAALIAKVLRPRSRRSLQL